MNKQETKNQTSDNDIATGFVVPVTGGGYFDLSTWPNSDKILLNVKGGNYPIICKIASPYGKEERFQIYSMIRNRNYTVDPACIPSNVQVILDQKISSYSEKNKVESEVQFAPVADRYGLLPTDDGDSWLDTISGRMLDYSEAQEYRRISDLEDGIITGDYD
jgi:hypothetical protein